MCLVREGSGGAGEVYFRPSISELSQLVGPIFAFPVRFPGNDVRLAAFWGDTALDFGGVSHRFRAPPKMEVRLHAAKHVLY